MNSERGCAEALSATHTVQKVHPHPGGFGVPQRKQLSFDAYTFDWHPGQVLQGIHHSGSANDARSRTDSLRVCVSSLLGNSPVARACAAAAAAATSAVASTSAIATPTCDGKIPPARGQSARSFRDSLIVTEGQCAHRSPRPRHSRPRSHPSLSGALPRASAPLRDALASAGPVGGTLLGCFPPRSLGHPRVATPTCLGVAAIL